MRLALFFALAITAASQTAGWTDLGSGSILHNALGPGGVTVQDCISSGVPAVIVRGRLTHRPATAA